ncbi:MAG: GspH/FimT family pseudopilin [Methylococcales bacterium]
MRDTKYKGFTLIELMVTLSVSAILLTVGIPSFRSMTLNNKRNTEINKLVTDLAVARSESIKRGFNVSVCKSNDNATCSGTWADGWIVFVNTDNDIPAVVDAGELIIRVSQGSNWVPSGEYSTHITYSPTGFVNSGGHLKYCDDRGAKFARAVILEISGRTTLSTDSNNNRTHEDENGSDLTC